jgi:hypothetical protein
MRHFGSLVPLPVRLLAPAVSRFSTWRGLVAAAGCRLSLPTHSGSASIAAIPLSAITGRTEGEHGIAGGVGTPPQPERFLAAFMLCLFRWHLPKILEAINDRTDASRLRRMMSPCRRAFKKLRFLMIADNHSTWSAGDEAKLSEIKFSSIALDERCTILRVWSGLTLCLA